MTHVLVLSVVPEVPMCRICHDIEGEEELLSPCECSGTLATIHRSCLEHWLSASGTSFCELCHYQFTVQRKSRPLLEVWDTVKNVVWQNWNSKIPWFPRDVKALCALIVAGGVVAAEHRPPAGEAHPVWRRGVFSAHHSSGHHLRLALSSWCNRSPPLLQPAGGCGAHCIDCCSLHHLRLLDTGWYAQVWVWIICNV